MTAPELAMFREMLDQLHNINASLEVLVGRVDEQRKSERFGFISGMAGFWGMTTEDARNIIEEADERDIDPQEVWKERFDAGTLRGQGTSLGGP